MVGILEIEAQSPRVCVAGAGAIGLTLAARLQMAGYRVSLVARGESLSFVQENGIQLIDQEGEHRVMVNVGAASAYATADVLFLCPKSHDMLAMATSIRHLISPDTIVVPVINGIPWWYFDGIDRCWQGQSIRTVDPEGKLKRIIPSRSIVGITTMITVERVSPGKATTFNPLQITIGELDDKPSERLDLLARILERSGIATTKAVRIRDAIWTKVVRNLISNPVTAITGATLRQNFGNAYLADISRQMLREVIPVIASYGSRLEVDPETILDTGRKLGDVKTSMLQDLEKGKQLELASICDAVIELATLHGIEMPVTQAISNLAHFKSTGDGNAFAA
ncbi:2-dehydropantoate 2-reductase [Rhizobium leguminosarum]|uniref:2-dehydropantoate 2-reductase n=1 Tax=Rhizobium leguminosarum TaxID=384 RepID=A0A444I7I4_RHILE|nr:2-dehydropantoate 2-reductase [Rhizobium leguminosarum]RWX34446.1 2-dehydropantoate 2-reductase [Rhizobium leguminosarum]